MRLDSSKAIIVIDALQTPIAFETVEQKDVIHANPKDVSKIFKVRWGDGLASPHGEVFCLAEDRQRLISCVERLKYFAEKAAKIKVDPTVSTQFLVSPPNIGKVETITSATAIDQDTLLVGSPQGLFAFTRTKGLQGPILDRNVTAIESSGLLVVVLAGHKTSVSDASLLYFSPLFVLCLSLSLSSLSFSLFFLCLSVFSLQSFCLIVILLIFALFSILISFPCLSPGSRVSKLYPNAARQKRRAQAQ